MINIEELKFETNGLITAVTQDYFTGEVLMVAYMNEEALNKTLETGKVHYFSRSRNKLWLKGETSGNYQHLKEMFYDCDGDALLIKIEQQGEGACHTGERSCFFRKLYEVDSLPQGNFQNKEVVNELYTLIMNRKSNPIEGSYTNYLFTKGIDKILKKVGEEAAEVIIGAKNRSKEEVVYELSDLTYHSLVLMAELGITPEEIKAELAKRKK